MAVSTMLNRFLTVYSRLFALWVVLGGVAAFFFPQLFLSLKDQMKLFFSITMLGVGMVLNPRDFINILKSWKAVIIGTVSQFSIMPLLAFLIAMLFSFSDEFSLGLILAGCAPGAMASNVLCYLAGADVAYSVSLTTVSTLLSPVLTPLLTLGLAHQYLEIPFWSMFQSVSMMVVVPLFAGLAAKKFLGRRIDPVIKVFPAISTTFIVFICALVIALNKSVILELSPLVLAAVLLLNFAGLLLGYGVGHFFRFDVLRKRALSIEIGMQNAGLGSVLAIEHFNARVALPSAVFVFVCIFSAAFLVQVWSVKVGPVRAI